MSASQPGALAAQRRRELPIAVEVALPANAPAPPRVDLFEEPSCPD